MSQRVLLSIEQQCYRELLQHALRRQPNVEVICQTCNYVECLAAIAQHQPQIWIHSAGDSPDMQATMERAYELAPQLAIVRVNPSESAGYLQVRMESIFDVLGLLERMDLEPEYSAWGAEAARPSF